MDPNRHLNLTGGWLAGSLQRDSQKCRLVVEALPERISRHGLPTAPAGRTTDLFGEEEPQPESTLRRTCVKCSEKPVFFLVGPIFCQLDSFWGDKFAGRLCSCYAASPPGTPPWNRSWVGGVQIPTHPATHVYNTHGSAHEAYSLLGQCHPAEEELVN